MARFGAAEALAAATRRRVQVRVLVSPPSESAAERRARTAGDEPVNPGRLSCTFTLDFRAATPQEVP